MVLAVYVGREMQGGVGCVCRQRGAGWCWLCMSAERSKVVLAVYVSSLLISLTNTYSCLQDESATTSSRSHHPHFLFLSQSQHTHPLPVAMLMSSPCHVPGSHRGVAYSPFKYVSPPRPSILLVTTQALDKEDNVCQDQCCSSAFLNMFF